MRLKIVSVRLKPEGIYNNVKIAASIDAAIFLEKNVGEDINENTMHILNLNAKGAVQALNVCSYDTFKANFNKVLAGAVLSNANGMILAGRGVNSAKDKLIQKFICNANLLGIPCLDYICFEDGYVPGSLRNYSYREKELLEFNSVTHETLVASVANVSKKDVMDDVVKLQLSTDRYLKNADTELTKEAAIRLIAKELAFKDREYFAVISFNGEKKPINASYVSIGDLTSALSHPREVFKTPLLSGAESIIVLHNHPSGDLKASDADKYVADRLGDVGRMFGIKLEDSLIVGALSEEIYSLKDNGDIKDIDITNYLNSGIRKNIESISKRFGGEANEEKSGDIYRRRKHHIR